MLFAIVVGALASRHEGYTVNVNWTDYIGTSKCTTTLQVVSNPILDREFTTQNGTKFPNPIHDTAWKMLSDLEADLVRYVPWFPYPRKSVAELSRPDELGTSWDFSGIMPSLYDFLAATERKNHSVVINFSTQPCWLFSTSSSKCKPPSNPDQSDFSYVKSVPRSGLLDTSGRELAGYYARVFSWLTMGEFMDEHGKHHVAPQKFNLSKSRGHVWEVFNEGEHDYSPLQYARDYGRVTAAITSAVGEENAPAFMGIAGAPWGLLQLPNFLNASFHQRSSRHECNPASADGCNVCAACCQDYIPDDDDGASCDGCVQEMCANQ